MADVAGIVGFCPRQANDDAEALVRDMLHAIAHRGPDGSAVRSGAWGAIGLARFVTAVDRTFDDGPVEAGPWLLVADVRLDEREEAAKALGLDARAVSDAGLLAAGLTRAPLAFPDSLLGDFALAAIDRDTGRLVCARDPLGVKPLYYVDLPQGFAFASEPKALFALPFVPRGLDDETLADFVCGNLDDQERTIHRAVKRVPAFHRLERSPDGSVVLHAYGTFADERCAAADAPVGLRTLLHQAVANRLRGARAPGVLLSGGLDSSSIAVLAAEVAREDGAPPVRTFSAVFDETPAANERPQIEAVLATAEFAPVLVPEDGLDPLAPVRDVLAAQGEPVYAPGLGVLQPVYAAAAAAGTRVLLDGHGGDEVISHGFARLGELARAGRWPTFLQSVSAVDGLYGHGGLGTAWRFGLGYGEGPAWRAARRCIRAWRRLRRGRVTQQKQAAPVALAGLSERLRETTTIEARVERRSARQKATFADERAAHRATIGSGFQVYTLEVLDRLAAGLGLEARFPFMDRRLVTFCLGLPSEAKLGEGFTRLVLRKAMQGLLPRSVQWRRDKLDFGYHLAEGLRRHRLADLDAILVQDDTVLSPYFDMETLRRAHRLLLARGPRLPGAELQLLWRAVVLGLWLRDVRPAGVDAEPRPAAVMP
jgi:asparagine synthase (glutamine-hydrolysing)